MSLTKKQLLLSLLTFLFLGAARAQTAPGKLTGKATDASTNEPLSGVSITLKTTRKGVSTITDGTYIFSLPAGTYTVVYSSSGYQAKELTGVVIKSGSTTFLDIVLQAASKELEGVVVSASVRKEAQSALYSAQKRSAAASDGISLEAIRKTPDNHAGQILRRVVGLNVQDNRFVVVRGLNDQYNQTMLNGVPMTSTETNRNAFAFDLIPAAVIDNITVNKTATPDMPGNFAGGIVQINTKDFPAKDFFSITLQGGLSDQTYGKDFYANKRSSLSFLGFSEKSLELPDNFPTSTSQAPIFTLNPQERSRYLRMLPNNLIPINYGPSRFNDQVQLGFGKTIKFKNESQLGLVAAISQRKNELIENEITARNPVYSQNALPDTVRSLAYYSRNVRYRYLADLGGVLNVAYRFGNNKITLKNLYSRVLSNVYTDRPLVRFGNESFYNIPDQKYVGITHVIENKSIFNSTLAGEHRIGANSETKLDWNVNVTSYRTNTPDTRNFIFGLKDTVKNIITGSERNVDYPSALVGSSRAWSYNKDYIYGGAFNVTTPFVLHGNKQLFKTGILFQNRQREVTGTVIPVTGIPATTLDSVLAPSHFIPGGTDVDIQLVYAASTSSNYNAGSSLLAAYESIENKIGKTMRIIWGLRIENYQQSIAVFTPVYLRDFQDPLQQTAQFGSRTTFNFLPSLNIVYSPVPSMNIRGGYSNTVIRPELKDLASFARYDYESFTLTQGDRYLKSASITNYDVKLEWFPSSGEIISISAFYKKLKDPIEYARGETGIPSVENYRIPVNSGDAYVKGMEAEIRKKLDFVKFAPWLSHVTLFGNGTLLRSHVKRKDINNEYFSYVGEHTLSGQADYILNAGMSLLLFNNTFESTVSLNRTGDYNNELGSSNYSRTLKDGELVAEVPPYRVKARNLVDLVVTQALWKEKCRLKFNVANLLNQRYILYQDNNRNGKFDSPMVIDPTKSENNYRSGSDNTASSITPQRTWSFSVTYTF